MNRLPTYDNISLVYEGLALPELDSELISHKKEQIIFMVINLLRVKPQLFNEQINNIKTKCELRQKAKNLAFTSDDVESTLIMLSKKEATRPLKLAPELVEICKN